MALQTAYEYCERTSESLLAEPINTLTNLAFIVAAVVAYTQARRAFQGRIPPALLTLLGLLFAIGVGSFVFHAAGGWTVFLDVIPIALLILTYFVLVTHYFYNVRWALAVLVAPAFLLVAGLSATLAGFLAFYVWGVAMLVGFAVAMLARTHLRGYGLQLLGVAVLFGVSLTSRQLDPVLCNAIPFGTHFVWHTLNAVVLYLGIRILTARVAATRRDLAPPNG